MPLGTKQIDSIVRDTAAGKRKPQAHGDGGGLYLQAQTSGASWLFRFTFHGVRRNMGLGDITDPSASLRPARWPLSSAGWWHRALTRWPIATPWPPS